MKDIIFDLDSTLIDDNFNLFPQVEEILELLSKNNVKMYLCSHNYNGDKIVKKLNIDKYFIDTECEVYNITKLPNIYKLIKRNNLKNNNLHFFDDMIENLKDFKKIGINGTLVNPWKGVSMKQILNIINI